MGRGRGGTADPVPHEAVMNGKMALQRSRLRWGKNSLNLISQNPWHRTSSLGAQFSCCSSVHIVSERPFNDYRVTSGKYPRGTSAISGT